MLICCLEIQSGCKYIWLDLFKCAFEAEKIFNVQYKQMLRGMFARFRLRASGLKSYKKWFTSKQEGDFTCRMSCREREDGIHFVFLFEAYTALVKELQHILLTTHQSIYVDT